MIGMLQLLGFFCMQRIGWEAGAGGSGGRGGEGYGYLILSSNGVIKWNFCSSLVLSILRLNGVLQTNVRFVPPLADESKSQCN